MLISDVGEPFRYLLFHLASWKKVQSLHLNSGKINSEYCRKQFEVLGVERKGLRWCSGVGIGHRTVGEYTTSVEHSPDLDFKRQIGGLDQICTIMCFVLLSNNDIRTVSVMHHRYFNIYSSRNDLLSLCAVYLQHCPASHSFSYTHWLLGAALHCYYVSNCIWTCKLLICICPLTEIMLPIEWQIDSCEWPSVTSNAWRRVSPAQCIVNLPLCVHNIGRTTAVQS